MILAIVAGLLLLGLVWTVRYYLRQGCPAPLREAAGSCPCQGVTLTAEGERGRRNRDG
jgi:hypothetical protein